MGKESLGEQIVARKWHQGAMVRPADLPDLCGTSPSAAYGILITHTCDLTESAIEKEPYIHLIPAREVVHPDGSVMYAKSTRQLHLVALTKDGPGNNRVFELWFRDLLIVSRERISNIYPCQDCWLSQESVNILRRWLSSRFERSALPDSFWSRVKPKEKHFRKALKKLHPDISDIYIALHPDEEIPDSDQYSIEILCVCAELSEVSEETKAAGKKLKDVLEAAGIDVTGFRIDRSDKVSLYMVSRMKRLSVDDISLRG